VAAEGSRWPFAIAALLRTGLFFALEIGLSPRIAVLRKVAEGALSGKTAELLPPCHQPRRHTPANPRLALYAAELIFDLLM
jgi:hypothetical protein